MLFNRKHRLDWCMMRAGMLNGGVATESFTPSYWLKVTSNAISITICILLKPPMLIILQRLS